MRPLAAELKHARVRVDTTMVQCRIIIIILFLTYVVGDTAVFSPGPFSRVAPSAFTVSLTLKSIDMVQNSVQTMPIRFALISAWGEACIEHDTAILIAL